MPKNITGSKNRPRAGGNEAAKILTERKRVRRNEKQNDSEVARTMCSMSIVDYAPKYNAPKRHVGLLGLPAVLRNFRFKYAMNTMTIGQQKHHTFEDLYRQSKKTRGRLGLNYEPDRRKDENPWQTHHYVGTFKFPDMVSNIKIKDFNNKSIKWFARY